MKYLLLRLKRFCGFLTGLVFFISGILKLLDPVGAGLVMKEYFDFLHIGFMGFSAKPLGVLLALAETVIGTGLITGVWRRTFALTAILFQGFFTFLTLLLVIFNPEMDCGCFGEAIHLTHWQTFLKNLVLCALLAAYYFPPKLLGMNRGHKYVSFAIVTVSVIAFATYSWLYIPLTDFTDFKPAARLAVGQENDGDEVYESAFVYEKDGVQKTFDLDHLPDSTWAFVRTDTQLRDGIGSENSINLSFYDSQGNYHDTLASDGKVMVVSVYNTDIKESRWKKIDRFMENASAAGFRPLLLVSSIPENVDARNMYICDYKTLVTMNRSNGGVTYFNDGYLIRKWAMRAMPDRKELEDICRGDATETIIGQETKGSLGLQGFLLYVFAVLLLL